MDIGWQEIVRLGTDSERVVGLEGPLSKAWGERAFQASQWTKQRGVDGVLFGGMKASWALL